MHRKKPLKHMALLSAAAIGLLFVVAAAVAEVQRPDLGDMKKARKEAAQRPRRILVNDDGDDVRPYTTPEELLALRVRQVANTQVDTICYCTGGGGLFWAHQPEFGEVLGEFVDETSGQDARSMRDGLIALKKLGTDPLAVVVDFGHKNNMEVFWDYRMNNIEDSFAPWALARWKREHPEYLVGVPSDSKKYPVSDQRFWWSSCDFAKPEVRDYVFGIFEDVCQRYDIDGVDMDFLRHPMFFRPTLDGHPVEPEHVAMMTDLMRRIRAMTERVSLERGRPLLISIRTPLSLERSLAIGLDISTYLEEDLVDILVIGGGYSPMGVASCLEEIVELGHQHQVPVYAWLGPPQEGKYNTMEAWRGAAMNRWYWGADGIYIFNLFPAKPDERFSLVGSVETLKGLDKTYAMDCIIPADTLGSFKSSLVLPNRLPLVLEANVPTTAKLPVGEDIVANAPPGKTVSARLGLQVSTLVEGDAIKVRLNGHSLGTPKPVEPLTAKAASVAFLLDIDPKLVRPGYNLVEVELVTKRSVDKTVVLDALNLTVGYK